MRPLVASGGILGMGSRETVLPLAELLLKNDGKIHSPLTRNIVSERPEFIKANYGVMEADRLISDFSAFEPTRSAGQAIPGAIEQTRSQRADSSDPNDSPLHQFTPDQLRGMEVVGSDNESIGKVKEVVGKKDADKVYAVVSSGGFMGIGTREILIPLIELTNLGDDQLQARFGQEAVESHPQYQLPEYMQLRDNLPISDFLEATRANSTVRPVETSRLGISE